MKQVNISQLKPWEDNPRDITEDKFRQLLKQLRYGEVENLIVMKDGTVLSGNRRLDAYKIVGKDTAWVQEVEFKQEDGVWHLYTDGELAIHLYPENMKGVAVEFKTELQGKIEIMALGNSHVGTYNDLDLAEMVSQVDIESDLFEVNLKSGTRLEDLMAALGPTPEVEINPEAEEQLENKSPIREIKFYLKDEDFIFAKNTIKKWIKEGNMKNPNEVFVEAMIAMDDRLDGINYNG